MHYFILAQPLWTAVAITLPPHLTQEAMRGRSCISFNLSKVLQVTQWAVNLEKLLPKHIFVIHYDAPNREKRFSNAVLIITSVVEPACGSRPEGR